MGLFKRKQQAKFSVRIFNVGDIVFVNGAIYKVEVDKLQQLPVAPIIQGQDAEKESN